MEASHGADGARSSVKRPEVEQAIDEFIATVRQGETPRPEVLRVAGKVVERLLEAKPDDTWDDLLKDDIEL